MAIKCGHCKESHGTVAQVRACSASDRLIPAALRKGGVEAAEREMHRMEAEADRAESLRDSAAKAAKWAAEAREIDFADQMRNMEPSELIQRVNDLLEARAIPENEWLWARAVRRMISGENGLMTEFALKTAIARLEAFPEISSPVIPAPRRPRTEMVKHEGLYRLSRDVRGVSKGTFVQVVRTKNSANLYAKTVHFPKGETRRRPVLEYVRGLIFDLLDEELLPAEEAQEITRQTGWCVFGHFLTNPKSIARGMGPVCYSRYPHLAKAA